MSKGFIGTLFTSGVVTGLVFLTGCSPLWNGTERKKGVEVTQNEEIIARNRIAILEREDQLKQLSEEAIQESFQQDLDPERKEKLYLGDTLGNPYR